jgi:PAS domain-containing protein
VFDVSGASNSGTTGGSPRSLPLILARELAANLATPMFLLDADGMLVFYNEAAALLIGRPFGELGEIPSSDFARTLDMATPDGEKLRSRMDSPAGIAYLEHRPAHASLWVTNYAGQRLLVDATAYPLFGSEGIMHGVISVFWEHSAADEASD